MNPEQKLLNKFETELKYRVDLKTSPSSVPEKVLLESFKYFDLNKTGKVDFKTFLMVIKMRLGIILFSEEDLMVIFNCYSNGSSSLTYREFISIVYDTQINLSLKDSRLSESRSFINSHANPLNDEETARKLIEYIVYKMRTLEFSSFFKLYRELQNTKVTEKEISQSQFVIALKKTGIEISAEEIQKVYNFISGNKPLLSIDRLFETLLVNYTESRKNLVRNTFEKLDYTSSGKISLNLFKELYNPRNTFAVKEGRQVVEELTTQFNFLVDEYTKFNGNQFILNSNQFLHFYSFISGYIKDDKEFFNFAESCFRFNELPRSSGSVRNDRALKTEHRLLEELSVKTSKLEDFYAALATQLSSKGNKAFIMFYKSLKCNDFDSDGYLFEKEFEKAISESRITFSKTQTQKLYEKMAEQRQRLNYGLLLQNLVPEFDAERTEIIQALYEKLTAVRPNEELSFDKFVNSFNARNHPDFKNGLRADYEIRTEFMDSLKEFMALYQGNSLVISWPALLRFYEFFAANWTTNHLRSIIESSFKVRTGSSVYSLEQTTPYGISAPENKMKIATNKPALDNQANFQNDNQPKINPALSSKFKFFEEYTKKNGNGVNPDGNAFKKKSDANPINYPYNTENDKVQVVVSQKFQNYKTTTPFFVEENKQHGNGKINDVKVEGLNELARTPDSKTSRYSRKVNSRESEFNPNLKEKLEPGQRNIINSPEEGSVVSNARSRQVINDLNHRLQTNQSQKSTVNPQMAAQIQQKFLNNLRAIGKIPLLLQIEFDMTAQSDKKGNVDFEVFSTVLDNYDLLKGFKQEEIHTLFVANITEPSKVHIQTFANKIRGQMSQHREKITIDLFDRICPPNEDAMLIPEIKAAFLPHKCKLRGYASTNEVREMLNTLLDLFMNLNVTIKDKDFIDLDDFLYMFDNFSFFMTGEEEYARFLSDSFK